MPRIGQQLEGVSRCPYCGVANPVLMRLWQSERALPRATEGPTSVWAAYHCTSCGSVILAKGYDGEHVNNPVVDKVIPPAKAAHEDIPNPARVYLQQAYETLRQPDAAAVMAGSAVDAMLKELGYLDGSVYVRIDKAVEEHKLTESMGEWAHEVRLGANRPRHADAENPHVTHDEAAQSVEFAEALAYFLFVLTMRVERGTAAAKKASGS